jgi:hypothetical protein
MWECGLSHLSVGIFLPEPETRATGIYARLIRLGLATAWRCNGSSALFEPFRLQPDTRVKAGGDFFIWIRCNPLKSPDSTKGIQGNTSFFPWFYLDSFGFTWPELASWLNSVAASIVGGRDQALAGGIGLGRRP